MAVGEMWRSDTLNDSVSGRSIHNRPEEWEESNATDSHLDSRSLYTHNPPPYTILFVFVTVLVGVIMRLVQHKLPIPYTVIIMIFGIIYGILAVTVYKPLANYTSITRIDPHWILQIFLPILIFESSFTINFQMFRKAVGQILILATGGLALATCLTAVVVKYSFNYGWNWCASLMFGALRASPELGVVLEGESLLNDGTAIIFFNIFLALNTIPDNEFSAESLVVQSFLTVAGGPLFGFVCGWIASWFIGRISNDAIAEVSVTLASTYLTFYISEALLNVSGVLAVVVLGLVLNHERTAISPEVEPWMHEFWSTLTYIANTLIFAIVGLTISEHALLNFTDTDWLNLLLLYGAITVIRLISIVVFLPVIQYVESAKHNCNWRNILVMGWGGLRGAVSLALAMTVSRDPRLDQTTIGDKVLIHTAGIVMLTLFVNGTTTAKLLSLLGMSRIPEQTIKAVDNALRHIFRSREREISTLKSDHFLDEVNWTEVIQETNLKNPYRKAQQEQKTLTGSLAVISQTLATTDSCGKLTGEEENYETTRIVWLKLLQHSFWEQFEKGLICRQTLVYLCGCVEKAFPCSDELLDADVITERFSIGTKLTYCQKMLNKLTGHDTGPLKIKAAGQNSMGSCRGRGKADSIVEACWFTALVYLTITVHVTAAIVNLALNWHGHHLDENFFHENVYFVTANGFFCLVYGIEIVLSIATFGFLKYIRKHWNKLELVVFAILLVDFILDVYVLAYGDGGSHIQRAVLRFFDVLSLLRILRAIRLVKLVFPMMGKFMESLVTHRLMSGFDIGQAFMTGQESATRWTESFIQNPAILTRLKITADVAHHKVLRELGILLEERPDIARAVKKRYATRKIIQYMRQDLLSLKTRGLLDEKAAHIFQNALHRRMEKVSRIPYRTVNPEDLLRRIPWIKNNRQLRAFLMNKALFYKFQKHHLLISAGEEPMGIFVILYGIVKIYLDLSWQKKTAKRSLGEKKWRIHYSTGDYKGPPVLPPNVVLSHQDFTEKTCFGSGETVGEHLVITRKKSPMSYVCRTSTQVLCIPSNTMQEAIQKFDNLAHDLWDCVGRKMTTVLLANQPTFHHLSADKIAKRVNKGAVVLLRESNFTLLPEWELVILLHGCCVGLPQEIDMEGPKIISNQILALQFTCNQDTVQSACAGNQPVLFILSHEILSRTISLDRHNSTYDDTFQTHHV